MLKVRAALNPRAGLRAQRALAALRAGQPAWGAVEVTLTERRGHAEELAREAARAGCELLLAAGGDGTVNEAATGLLGSDTVLGIVPVGSGNGLARALGIPLAPERALGVLADGVVRKADVGFLNQRPFLNVAGAGFDAEVAAVFDQRTATGQRRGIAPMVVAALRLALSWRAPELRIDAPAFAGRPLLVDFFNGRQYGGGATLAPHARLDDGLLEFVVCEDVSRLRILLGALRLFLGGVERLRFLRRAQAPSAVLAAEAPLRIQRDGEPDPPAERIEVRVEPRALSLLVPRAAAEDPAGPFLAPP